MSIGALLRCPLERVTSSILLVTLSIRACNIQPFRNDLRYPLDRFHPFLLLRFIEYLTTLHPTGPNRPRVIGQPALSCNRPTDLARPSANRPSSVIGHASRNQKKCLRENHSSEEFERIARPRQLDGLHGLGHSTRYFSRWVQPVKTDYFFQSAQSGQLGRLGARWPDVASAATEERRTGG